MSIMNMERSILDIHCAKIAILENIEFLDLTKKVRDDDTTKHIRKCRDASETKYY